MPGRGPVPAERKRRRNVDTYAENVRTVTDDGVPRGPEADEDWSAETRQWWEDWRRSPQAQVFLLTDWHTLRDVARLREAFYAGDLKLAAEIRQRETLLGATHADRLRSRLKVERVGSAPEASVTRLYDRDRLAGGS